VWILTCPECGHAAPAKAFGWGLTPECWCPECECGFQWDPPEDDFPEETDP
jgi:hypothetical protein